VPESSAPKPGSTAADTQPDAPRAEWSELLATLCRGEDLRHDQAAAAMTDIMAGRVGAARIGGFLLGLRAKGETAVEVAAAAQAMRDAARPWPGSGACIDIVGTGGDNSGTVNISTLAAIIAAACGVRVIKHGNRAASSASGAGDVLESLGLPLEASPEVMAAVADEVGLGFAFAPVFHPAMRHAAPVRKELGIPTVFNILGPLTNPAAPVAGLIGCADARVAPVMAEVFARRGEHMLVVRGDDGWDEITPQTTTRIWAQRDGRVHTETVEPAAIGLAGIRGADLTGGDATHNAEVIRVALGLPRVDATLTLQADPQAVAAVAVANAAGALAAAHLAGLGIGASPASSASWSQRIAAEVPRASAAVTSGAAGALLQRWIQRLREISR
jgi:anthranilate phosphoribosyltransferase